MNRKRIIFCAALILCLLYTIPAYAATANYRQGLTNLIEIGKLVAIIGTIYGFIHEVVTRRNVWVIVVCIAVCAWLVHMADVGKMGSFGTEIHNVLRGGSLDAVPDNTPTTITNGSNTTTSNSTNATTSSNNSTGSTASAGSGSSTQ